MERQWSRGEELANSLSHGFGFFAALIGAPYLLRAGIHHGGVRPILGMGVFAVATMLLYLSSTVHHWLAPGRAKEVFEIVDHAAIFLMIAGTYTPFATGVLWGPWGWLLLGIIWPLALCGVLLKSIRGVQPRRFTIALYVLMGWLIVVAFRPLIEHVPAAGLQLLVGGGIAYTAGLVFYVSRRMRYHHLAWHLSVLLGTALHYFAVLRYAS